MDHRQTRWSFLKWIAISTQNKEIIMINRRNIVLAIVIALVIAFAGAVIKNGASATEGDECVPSEGTPGQHYSWTGGNLPTDQPPTEVPPSDNWQANTSQEPHDNGQGNPATWVNDSLHYTANSQGHASWFYYEHPTPAVDCPPEQPDPEEFTTMDQKKDCDGIWLRLFDWEQPYVWDEQTESWILGEAVQVKDSGWLLVRELTEEEKAELECDVQTEQPDPVVQEASSTSLECDSDTQTTTHTVTTTEYVLVNGEWVLGEPETVETVTTEEVEVVPCDKPKDPKDPKDPENEVKHTSQTVQVPTSVDAGM